VKWRNVSQPKFTLSENISVEAEMPDARRKCVREVAGSSVNPETKQQQAKWREKQYRNEQENYARRRELRKFAVTKL